MPIPRRPEIVFEHPPTTPERLPGRVSYLIDVPGPTASSAKLRLWLTDYLPELIASHPGDPNFPAIRDQIERVLSWRATVPPEDHFWKADPAAPGA